MNRSHCPFLVLGVALATLAASADEAPDPALQVRNRALDVQWVEPGVRPAPFDKVMLAPIELAFRDVKPLAGPTGYTGSRTTFPVDERGQAEIAADFDRILREELGDSRGIALVDAPGPGVLLVKPALRDIVSRVPPEEPAGRSATYLDSVGEATLVVEFVDAATGRTLGTATDQRAAEPVGGVGSFGAVKANEVGVGQEVRRLARRWGTSLKERIEQLYFEAKPR